MTADSQIVKFTREQLDDTEIECIAVKDEIRFKGKTIASALGYSNTRDAIITHVEDEDKQTFQALVSKLAPSEFATADANALRMVFINESGMYSLILRSNKTEARVFKKCVTSEVLPSIRRVGIYAPKLVDKQMQN